MTGAQQHFDGGNLDVAPRDLTLEIRPHDYYFAVAGCGFGAHLCPVFAMHPIWWPSFFTPCAVFCAPIATNATAIAATKIPGVGIDPPVLAGDSLRTRVRSRRAAPACR